MKSKKIWLANLIGLLICLGIALWLYWRPVDGSGLVESSQTKVAALLVFGTFVGLVIVIELMVLALRKLRRRH